MIGNSTAAPPVHQPLSLKELATDVIKKSVSDDKKSRDIARKELHQRIPRSEVIEMFPIIQQPRPGQLGAMRVSSDNYRYSACHASTVTLTPVLGTAALYGVGTVAYIPLGITTCPKTASFASTVCIAPATVALAVCFTAEIIGAIYLFRKAAYSNAWYGFQ